jgi:hypothetical protein
MKKLILLLGILGIFISCNTFSNKINLNISNTNETIIIKNENGINVNRLYCRIKGKVNGLIEIEFTNDEGTFSRKIIPENGKIDFIYGADWYDNDIVINIISNNNTSGYINIKYRFKKF